MSSGQANRCEVAVVGAGPYGLSVAAHLRRAGIATHVFGEPMGFWRHNMPKGMLMRSPWRATHLSDPGRAFSLEAYASSGAIDSGCLKPGASGWLKPRFTNVACNPGRSITGVRVLGDRIALDLDDAATTFDHVLLGTGYQVDVSRLGILAPQLLERIACAEGSPLLGPGFESSVPKLHFVGCYAVKSFGPLLWFIAGAAYAARAVTDAARRRATSQRDPVPAETLFGAVATQPVESP